MQRGTMKYSEIVLFIDADVKPTDDEAEVP